MDNTTHTAPPADHNAESALLGAYLNNPENAAEHTGGVAVEHFDDQRNQAIWSAVQDLSNDGITPDAVLIADRIGATNTGIYAYIANLIASPPPVLSLPHYVEILNRQRTARALLQATQTIAITVPKVASASPDEVEPLLTEAQNVIYEVGEESGVHDSLEPIDQTILNTLDSLDPESENSESNVSYGTGFPDLDAALGGGMHPGELIIIGARPGVGKSTIAVDILRHNAIKMHVPCAMFSLEMTRRECAQRILSAEGEIPLSTLRAGSVTSDKDWDTLGKVLLNITDAPMFIDDTPEISINYLKSNGIYLARRHGLKVLVVDYMQLMSSSNPDYRQGLSEISRGLKVFAKKMGVVVIAVCQLNRGPESRPDKKPQASDLRDTGQLEQDADTIMLLYREDSYDPDSMRAGEADVIIGKQRHGPQSTVTLAFQGHYCRCVSLAPEPPL